MRLQLLHKYIYSHDFSNFNIVTPRACTRGKVIGRVVVVVVVVVVVISTKIAISRDIGV